MLARAKPDEWLPESSISRRVNLRVQPPIQRQALRFHFEQLEEADILQRAEPEPGDDEPYYQLTPFGREFAVRMELVD